MKNKTKQNKTLEQLECWFNLDIITTTIYQIKTNITFVYVNWSWITDISEGEEAVGEGRV